MFEWPAFFGNSEATTEPVRVLLLNYYSVTPLGDVF